MDGGRAVEFDPAAHPHLDHGYAVTSHSSQGQTAGRVLIHVDTQLGAKDLLNNRMAYVAVSRGAYDAQIFTDDREKLGVALGRDVSHKSALAPEKTRLIEFGRHAAKNRKRAGLGKPETFSFLGFTHLCGKTKRGRFLVLRQTIRKRMQAKLQEVKAELRRRMHDPVPEVGAWLKSVVSGHFRYFGVPGNGHAMNYFRFTVSNLWHRALCRRSQHGRVKWDRMTRLIRRWLPPAHICHPYPSRRLRVTT